MIAGARVLAAIEILDACLNGEPENKALLNWFRAHRFAGSKDRLAIRDIVFSCLRYKLSSFWPFKKAGFLLCGRILVIGMLKISNKCFDLIFDGNKYSPTNLSEIEKNILENFDDCLATAPNSVKLNYPEFLEKKLNESFGDKFMENMLSLNTKANLYGRVNHIKGNIGAVIESLRDDGIEVETVPNSKHGIKVTGNQRLFNKTTAYLSGKVEVQDIGSQFTVDFINPQKETRILDFCAGAGGKTLAMASATKGNAQFFAHDTNFSKLLNLKERSSRAGFDVKIFSTVELKKITERFDLVVADVPCSGTGVWKRNPGSKWSITKDNLNAFIAEQRKILQQAGNYVQRNGMLAYITCSILKSENQEQIEWFLSFDKTFLFQRDNFILPSDGGDGFYVSLLNKSQ